MRSPNRSRIKNDLTLSCMMRGPNCLHFQQIADTFWKFGYFSHERPGFYPIMVLNGLKSNLLLYFASVCVNVCIKTVMDFAESRIIIKHINIFSKSKLIPFPTTLLRGMYHTYMYSNHMQPKCATRDPHKSSYYVIRAKRINHTIPRETDTTLIRHVNHDVYVCIYIACSK